MAVRETSPQVRVAELRSGLLGGRGRGASEAEVDAHTSHRPTLGASPATGNRTTRTRTEEDRMTRSPSGRQFDLSLGEQHATVVEVGGGIREYRVGNRDVLEPYAPERMCDGAHGAPLIPWPNRLADGRYAFDGTDYQTALTEPDKSNAIHGFLRWRSWSAVDHAEDRVVMATTLHPLPGYPFTLDVRISYRLDHDGLSVTTTATNTGDQPCPYGSGQHPYLSPGEGMIDRCTLHLPADTRILTSSDRQLPVGSESVVDTAYDFRQERRLGDLEVDDAFTDLHRAADGRAWVRLTGSDDRTAQLWVDEAYPVIEIFTGDTLAEDRRRTGLGIEPMTCPPNAFQSGEQVIRLQPGESATSCWGAALTSS
jgi:aldose 1-epimerase